MNAHTHVYVQFSIQNQHVTKKLSLVYTQDIKFLDPCFFNHKVVPRVLATARVFLYHTVQKRVHLVHTAQASSLPSAYGGHAIP